MKTKAQLNWEVGKEAQEEFIKSILSWKPIIDMNEEKIRDLFYQIRQNEYRRGKEDAVKDKQEVKK